MKILTFLFFALLSFPSIIKAQNIQDFILNYQTLPEELFKADFYLCKDLEENRVPSKEIRKLRDIAWKARTNNTYFRRLRVSTEKAINNKSLSEQDLSEALFIRGWEKIMKESIKRNRSIEIINDGYKDIIQAHKIYPLSRECGLPYIDEDEWRDYEGVTSTTLFSPFDFYAEYLLKTEGHLRACNEALKYGAETLWYFNCIKFGDKYYLGLVLGRKYGERYIEAFNKKDEDFFLEVKEESDNYIARLIDRYNHKRKVINNSKKEPGEVISSKESYPNSFSEGIPNVSCDEGRKNYIYTRQIRGGFFSKSSTEKITLECLTPLEIAQIKTGIDDINKLKKKARNQMFINALRGLGNSIQTSTMQRTINGLQYRQITGY